MDTQSPFAYAGNDPVNASDPEGNVPSGCGVVVDDAHESSTRGDGVINVHARVVCAEPVERLTLWVQLAKASFFGYTVVNPGKQVSNTGKAVLQSNDTSATCTNKKSTKWFGLVKSATATVGATIFTIPGANGQSGTVVSPHFFTANCGT